MFLTKNHIFLSALVLCYSLVGAQSKQDSTNLKNFDLEPLVITANRFDSKLSESITKIDIIDNKKVSISNGNKLADILQTTPNVTIKSYGQTPALQTISMNGLGAEHTLILIDGVRLNSFQNSQVDLSLIPKEIIEKIEIVNNGSSSTYGSDAIGGVVNIITKKHSTNLIEKNIGIELSTSYGSYNTKNYSIRLSNNLKSLRTNIFYSKQKSDGDFKYYYHRGDETISKTRENANYDIWDAGINLSYFISSKSYLSLLSTYTDQDKHIPGIETGNKSSNTTQRDRNWNTILKYENSFSDKSIFTVSFNLQNNLMNYVTYPLTDSQYKNLVYSSSVQYNHKFVFFQINSVYDFTHANLISNELEGNPLRNQHALSLAADIELPLQTKVIPSVRFESISDIDTSVVTAKIGINTQPIKTIPLHLRGNIGSNFRSPSFNDLYWKISGNENLNPESSTNFELGLIYYPLLSKQIAIEYSYLNIKTIDKIVWTPTISGLWTPNNIASSKSIISSISIKYHTNLDESVYISGDVGAVFNSSKKTSEKYPGDPSYNKQIIYIPESVVKANFILDIQKYSLGIFYSFIDKRYSDMNNKKSLAPNHLVNVNLGYTHSFSVVSAKIQFEINNLFDADYQVISGYPMPLRNFLFKLIINY